MRALFLFLISTLAFCLISLADTNEPSKDSHFIGTNLEIDRPSKVLNDLKDEINALYGFIGGSPRINSGPCGRFAYLFYQEWNKNFKEKVTISFVMSADSSECYHVLIHLPNNRYYDGGNGLLKPLDLVRGYEEGMYIIEMLEFNLELLDEMSYGLDREYEHCPNYSDEATNEIIQKHLHRIERGRI